MRIGLIQFHVCFGEKEKNLLTVERLLKMEEADLWVLPELFNTGYLFVSQKEVDGLAEEIPDGETTRSLIDLSKKYDTAIVAGLAERASGKYYNSAILVDQKGLIGRYRKLHLFDREKKWFSPGDLPFNIWDLGEAKVGMMICFDWIFPESARTLALKGADIICHPSNLVMPYCQNAMVTRCLENRIFAITANRIGEEERGGLKQKFTGRSQITNFDGEILYRALPDKEQIVVLDIDPSMARNKNINDNNNLFNDRRNKIYEWN